MYTTALVLKSQCNIVAKYLSISCRYLIFREKLKIFSSPLSEFCSNRKNQFFVTPVLWTLFTFIC